MLGISHRYANFHQVGNFPSSTQPKLAHDTYWMQATKGTLPSDLSVTHHRSIVPRLIESVSVAKEGNH